MRSLQLGVTLGGAPLSGRVTVDAGFICSVAPPSAGAPPISLLVHEAPYTLGRQSGLGRTLLNPICETPDLLRRAKDLLSLKQECRISRYNHLQPDAFIAAPGRRRVLVVGPEVDDVHPGGTSVSILYDEMLRAARLDYPSAQIVLLSDRVSRRPVFRDDTLRMADRVVSHGVDRLAAVMDADVVYTAGGLSGLEAVLAEREVVCFGQPFFTGLGLTDDRGPTAGPAPLRTREAVFAAAYLLHARYVDPLSGEACEPEVAFERLAAFKRHADRVAGRWIGLNIPAPKRGVLRAFLAGPRSTLTFGAAPSGARPSDDTLRLAAWVSRPNKAVEAARRSLPNLVVNVEDGFLRSVGLGSSFQPASSLVFDARGIYYDPGAPSDLENLLLTAEFDEPLLAKAARLRAEIIRSGLSKYNVGSGSIVRPAAAAGRRIALVPGQVEGDASVVTGGRGMSNLDLLKAIRRSRPDAYIIYKEHPDVTAGNRRGDLADSLLTGLADEVVRGGDIIASISSADEVHTLTSLSGFEALIRGKPVTTYGAPFYAGWGLTEDRAPSDRPRRRLSLDALVAGALILYPLYLDPRTWLPCDAETFVARLECLRDEAVVKGSVNTAGKVMRVLTALRYSLLPRPSRLY